MRKHSVDHRTGFLTGSALLAIAAIALIPTTRSGGDDAGTQGKKPTIVLVHGAWADGSSWAEVSDRLQDDGFDVRVPPNNLRGVATDAPDLARYLESIDGPIVLAAHSYGGMVITNAAEGNDQVKALVYVDAFIPDEGETLVDLNQPPGIFAQDPANVFDVVPYTGAPEGVADAYVKDRLFREAFAADGLASRHMAVLAAAQRPLSVQAFAMPSGDPAWADIPSWAVVGEQDRIIPAEAQREMAQRAGARVTELDAPHLSMLTHDREVARVIVRAAKG
ncbi:MAG: alpha/beta hydrolase [Actinomycetota bacterium]|jgi:pimeloyl-ACP methyl ester carboxylesterase|nr:alpha/beta hydrolase [Actinomycetota bacterium]